MIFTFKNVATFTALLFLGLAATWMFVSATMLTHWGVDGTGVLVCHAQGMKSTDLHQYPLHSKRANGDLV